MRQNKQTEAYMICNSQQRQIEKFKDRQRQTEIQQTVIKQTQKKQRQNRQTKTYRDRN